MTCFTLWNLTFFPHFLILTLFLKSINLETLTFVSKQIGPMPPIQTYWCLGLASSQALDEPFCIGFKSPGSFAENWNRRKKSIPIYKWRNVGRLVRFVSKVLCLQLFLSILHMESINDRNSEWFFELRRRTSMAVDAFILCKINLLNIIVFWCIFLTTIDKNS